MAKPRQMAAMNNALNNSVSLLVDHFINESICKRSAAKIQKDSGSHPLYPAS